MPARFPPGNAAVDDVLVAGAAAFGHEDDRCFGDARAGAGVHHFSYDVFARHVAATRAASAGRRLFGAHMMAEKIDSERRLLFADDHISVSMRFSAAAPYAAVL